MGKSNIRMRLVMPLARLARCAVVVLCIAALALAETKPPSASSGTKKSGSGSSLRRAIRGAPQQLHKEIKKSKPNPKVQSPGTASAMPTQAPPMPEGLKPDTEPLPVAGADKFFNTMAKIMTKSWGPNIFVWLPAISTDPNAGPTIGILPVLVLADESTRRIKNLLAPSITYNDLFGVTGTMRYYWYPTDRSQLFAYGSYSAETNRVAKLRYENPAALEDVLYVRGEILYDVNGSQRFFGIGPHTNEGGESGYTFRQSGGRTAFGINFWKHMRTTIGGRFLTQETRDNIIPDLAGLNEKYPTLNGLGLQQTVSHEWRLTWDSRDIPVTPSRGQSAEVYLEKTNRGWGSDADYFRHGVDARSFFPWNNPRHLTVVRGFYERVIGPNIPFYELSQLGGRDTLRGFGQGRFMDSGRLGFNLEHRYTLASLKLMGISTNFEMAPFVDAGEVFPSSDQIQARTVQFVGGLGFRAAVKPSVVGDVEIGVGREGPAVFVDINYPF